MRLSLFVTSHVSIRFKVDVSFFCCTWLRWVLYQIDSVLILFCLCRCLYQRYMICPVVIHCTFVWLVDSSIRVLCFVSVFICSNDFFPISRILSHSYIFI
jgi:hypothetical protein